MLSPRTRAAVNVLWNVSDSLLSSRIVRSASPHPSAFAWS